MTYLSPPRPRVFGHRGAAAVAPENTLPSFAVAANLGATYLELDVHCTVDGTIVVLHDETVDRTTDGSGPVREMPWSEIQELDAGYWFPNRDSTSFPYRGQGVRVPTLESVVRAFPEHRYNIEIKQCAPAITDAVVSLLRREGAADRTLLAAENDTIMREIRRLAGGDFVTGSSTVDVLQFFAHLDAGTLDSYQPPGVALQIPTQAGSRILVTPQSLAAARDKGIEVHVWTINDIAEIGRLLALGVDGIMSDSPGLVAEAIRRR